MRTVCVVKAKMNTRELWREVVGQLAKLQTAHSDMEPAFLQEELGNEFAAIVQAFTILGAKRMEELGYSRSKIEAAMTRTEENVLLTAPRCRKLFTRNTKRAIWWPARKSTISCIG